MRRKSLYLVLAGVCGVIAAAISSQWLTAQANSKPVGVLSEIFVAAVAIDVGEEITAQKLQLEKWPADKIPHGASGTLSEIEGKFAKQRFYVGEAIMPVKLMDENWSAVRKGFKAVAMKASEIDIANLLQPGDRVDVMAYFSKSELVTRSTTKTILEGVLVYALDGNTVRRSAEDRPKSLRTIELLINEEDAEAWTYANELGNIRLSLVSQEQFDGNGLPQATGGDFLNWIEEQQQRLEESIAARERQLKKDFDLLESPSLAEITASIPVSTTPDLIEQITETSTAVEEEAGFSMVKMVEGKLVEYWVVPGKLPVVRRSGTENENRDDARSNSDSNNSENDSTNANETIVTEYSYLDGRKSPFKVGSNASRFQIKDK
jgi:pilus assembly protein CpaB